MTKLQGDKPEEMLKAVVEKGVDNGYMAKEHFKDIEKLSKNDIKRAILSNLDDISIIEILFSHSFAKAYWGEGEHIFDVYGNCQNCDSFQKEGTSYHWQHHLQQVVLSENPLLYYFERL